MAQVQIGNESIFVANRRGRQVILTLSNGGTRTVVEASFGDARALAYAILGEMEEPDETRVFQSDKPVKTPTKGKSETT